MNQPVPEVFQKCSGGFQPANELPWHVALTVPAREYRARDWAVERGFAVWLPECVVRRVTRTRVALSHKGPLFPGYLFVRLDARHPWRRLAEASAFVDLLAFDGEPALLRGAAAVRLRRLLAAGPLDIDECCRRRFAEGQLLRINGGVWEGHEGLYVASVKDRIKIMLDILGAARETLFPEALVEPA